MLTVSEPSFFFFFFFFFLRNLWTRWSSEEKKKKRKRGENNSKRKEEKLMLSCRAKKKKKKWKQKNDKSKIFTEKNSSKFHRVVLWRADHRFSAFGSLRFRCPVCLSRTSTPCRPHTSMETLRPKKRRVHAHTSLA